METTKTYQELLNELNATRSELEEARYQLEEATDIIEAIRSGDVDALVVKSGDEHQLFTLKNADQTYRIFIEQMIEGAVTLNTEGNILYSNSRFATLVGLPLEKVTGQPFCRFVTPEFEQSCPVLIAKAWEKDMKGELMLYKNNSEQVPVLLSLKTLNLDDGLSMSVIITDLSEQKETQQLLQEKNTLLEQAQKIAQDLNANLENTVKQRTRELEVNIQGKTKVEQELRSNQDRLTRILETMAEGVTIIDPEGYMTYANPMAKKILGLEGRDLSDTNFYKTQWGILKVDGSPLAPKNHPMRITMSTGKPVYDYEISIQPPDKERFFISINAAPLYNDAGKITGGVGTFMDVTNRRMEQQQKDDFISIASHELKTPITSLKASLQLLNRLKDNPTAPMLPKLIDQANKSMEKVNALVEDLLNASRMTDGQLHLKEAEFAIAKLIDDCCHHVRAEGMHTIINNGDIELLVFGDMEKLEQVLVNLVNNAVKYAPLSKEIIIDAQKDGNFAKVSVTDHGPGISGENIPHLFDRYYRVDSNGIRYSGLGLGLYISAEIIKKHGGQIGVNSKLGEGSSFWFTLPLQS